MQIQEMQSTYSQVAPLMEIPIDEEPEKKTRVGFDSHQKRSAQDKLTSRSNIPNHEAPSTGGKRVRVKINDSQRPIVAVVDSKTNEVIREVPPEQVLDMLDALNLDLGIIMDREV